MFASVSTLSGDGVSVYINLLLQLSFLSFAAIALSSLFRNNAVLRYSLLYSSLLSLLLLCGVSLYMQSKESGILRFQRLLQSPLCTF